MQGHVTYTFTDAACIQEPDLSLIHIAPNPQESLDIRDLQRFRCVAVRVLRLKLIAFLLRTSFPVDEILRGVDSLGIKGLQNLNKRTYSTSHPFAKVQHCSFPLHPYKPNRTATAMIASSDFVSYLAANAVNARPSVLDSMSIPRLCRGLLTCMTRLSQGTISQ